MNWYYLVFLGCFGCVGLLIVARAIERIAESIDNIAHAIHIHSNSIDNVAHEIHIHAETLNEIKHDGIGIDKKMTPGERFVSDIMRGKKVK